MTASLFHHSSRQGTREVLPRRLAQFIFLFSLALELAGCAIGRAAHVNYLVPIKAATRIELIDCDRQSPPNCRYTLVKYCKGCEQLEASNK